MENFPPLCFEFTPQILVCQSSRDKFSSYSAEQECDGSSSQFRNSLHSVVESFLCSEDNFSSSTERYSELPYWDHMPVYEQFSQEDVKLLGGGGDAAAAVSVHCLSPSISSGRIQQDKQSSQARRVACATSSNPIKRTTANGKRRIRWSKDLHESFVTIVNNLGGPEKAKPKAILEMMDTDLLTISQVKSHLQKYRTTACVQKALQERPVERHGADGVTELQVKIKMQIEESRQLQLDVWRSLQEQLEMQHNLRILIKQQKKKLHKMLDHQKQKSKLEKSQVLVSVLRKMPH